MSNDIPGQELIFSIVNSFISNELRTVISNFRKENESTENSFPSIFDEDPALWPYDPDERGGTSVPPEPWVNPGTNPGTEPGTTPGAGAWDGITPPKHDANKPIMQMYTEYTDMIGLGAVPNEIYYNILIKPNSKYTFTKKGYLGYTPQYTIMWGPENIYKKVLFDYVLDTADFIDYGSSTSPITSPISVLLKIQVLKNPQYSGNYFMDLFEIVTSYSDGNEVVPGIDMSIELYSRAPRYVIRRTESSQQVGAYVSPYHEILHPFYFLIPIGTELSIDIEHNMADVVVNAGIYRPDLDMVWGGFLVSIPPRPEQSDPNRDYTDGNTFGFRGFSVINPHATDTQQMRMVKLVMYAWNKTIVQNNTTGNIKIKVYKVPTEQSVEGLNGRQFLKEYTIPAIVSNIMDQEWWEAGMGQRINTTDEALINDSNVTSSPYYKYKLTASSSSNAQLLPQDTTRQVGYPATFTLPPNITSVDRMMYGRFATLGGAAWYKFDFDSTKKYRIACTLDRVNDGIKVIVKLYSNVGPVPVQELDDYLLATYDGLDPAWNGTFQTTSSYGGSLCVYLLPDSWEFTSALVYTSQVSITELSSGATVQRILASPTPT